MRENVGQLDQSVRSVFGSWLVARGLIHLMRGRPIRAMLNVLGGAFALESALTRVCPLNAALGLDTRSTAERLSDFRGDVNEQSARISHDYAKPLISDAELEKAAPSPLP